MAGLKLKYFVLNPSKQDEYGRASRNALLVYASTISRTNKELANDIYNWVESIKDQQEPTDG